jgi:hypothetical protein
MITPQRGDEVERWLKAFRDGLSPVSDDWHTVDWLLDNYREHADTGTPLDAVVNRGPAPGGEAGAIWVAGDGVVAGGGGGAGSSFNRGGIVVGGGGIGTDPSIPECPICHAKGGGGHGGGCRNAGRPPAEWVEQ